VGANVGVSQALPQDGVIQIAFDRFLNSLWVNRQSVALRDESGGAPDPPIIQYDPVTRVVTLSNPNPGQPWLQVNQFYEIFFPTPEEAGDFGLRAIDGATMDPATRPIGFMVTGPAGVPAPPKIDFCADVMPIFRVPIPVQGSTAPQRGACADCHNASPDAGLMGLVLDSEDGIGRTAIGVVASEANGTALASQPLAPQNVFPAGMPILDPGNPGDSFLMYKLLAYGDAASAGPIPYTACRPTTPPFDYGPGALATADEAQRLGDRVGTRMPWLRSPLTIDELERIRLWITQGAEVDDCSACSASSP